MRGTGDMGGLRGLRRVCGGRLTADDAGADVGLMLVTMLLTRAAYLQPFTIPHDPRTTIF